MVKYSERLRSALQQAGMSAAQLASKLGVSYQAVKKTLDERSTSFSAANNSRAASLLGVSGDWLATGEGSLSRNGGWTFPIPYEMYEALPWEKQQQLAAKVVDFIEGALPAPHVASKKVANGI